MTPQRDEERQSPFCKRCDGYLVVADHLRGIAVPCPACQPRSSADFGGSTGYEPRRLRSGHPSVAPTSGHFGRNEQS